MKRNPLFLTCAACLSAALLAACAQTPASSADSAAAGDAASAAESVAEPESTPAPAESEAAAEPESVADEEVYEYPAEDAGPIQEESRLGYSLVYDPTMFTLDDTGADLDVYYTFPTAGSQENPVQFTVQSYPDTDAQTLAEGVALQSGQDGVTAQSAFFGADSLEAQYVYYEEEVDGVTQMHTFFAVPAGEGSLLVEITSYADLSMEINGKLEEMAGTFTLVS